MRGHIQTLLNHFSHSYRVYLAAPNHGEWSLPGRDVYRLPLETGFSPAKDLDAGWRFYRLLRKIRPALLHIHGFKAFLIGSHAAALARVPVLVTVHNYPAHRGGETLLPPFSRLAGTAGAYYIAVSHALSRELAGWGIAPGRIRVIHNGIDPAPFEQAGIYRRRAVSGEAPLVVGTVARMAPQKGLQYLVYAAASLAGRYPRMRFVIAGDGPEQPALQELTRRMGLGGRISFPGFIRNIPAMLSQIDIFVLPSLAEGLAITLLEALAAGCAVVASRVGGVPEVIEHGTTGLLVPPASSGALAGAVAALAENPFLRRNVSLAGRKRVLEQFTIDKMLMQTGSVYESLITCPDLLLSGKDRQ
jgi:glycosyltransferase involved in cell wall biosynthesis